MFTEELNNAVEAIDQYEVEVLEWHASDGGLTMAAKDELYNISKCREALSIAARTTEVHTQMQDWLPTVHY